jgi:predicted enzyme related to lactoylglutathione lyase
MPSFSFVLLYVDSPLSSARFYEDLLGRAAVEAAPTFAMLPLTEGVMLGLWSKRTVAPEASPPGGSEIAFTVGNAEDVEATFLDWQKRGLKIEQLPTKMDFGSTFVALDPDGHRLRVFAPDMP